MDTKQQAIQLAAKLLRITEEEATQYCQPLTDLDAFYFSVPVKGGGSVIIRGQEVLYAVSYVDYDTHVQAFKDGIRTPLDAFEDA
jgi:hypothetical protein